MIHGSMGADSLSSLHSTGTGHLSGSILSAVVQTGQSKASLSDTHRARAHSCAALGAVAGAAHMGQFAVLRSPAFIEIVSPGGRVWLERAWRLSVMVAGKDDGKS